jgi:ATP-binding cassette subfamily C (CFTR/MRP) protein 1
VVDNEIELETFRSETPIEDMVYLTQATIRPAPSASPAISDVSFSVPKGSLTMIIGIVGSGKSTLLKAIAGELRCDTGSISVASKSFAYCSQMPWLQNASIRNIICSLSDSGTQDEEWYRIVIHACALNQDISELPDLDNTIIGSRGVVLSGGQKQRLVR